MKNTVLMMRTNYTHFVVLLFGSLVTSFASNASGTAPVKIYDLKFPVTIRSHELYKVENDCVRPVSQTEGWSWRRTEKYDCFGLVLRDVSGQDPLGQPLFSELLYLRNVGETLEEAEAVLTAIKYAFSINAAKPLDDSTYIAKRLGFLAPQVPVQLSKLIHQNDGDRRNAVSGWLTIEVTRPPSSEGLQGKARVTTYSLGLR